jgi:iron complex outermembrane receptor protein
MELCLYDGKYVKFTNAPLPLEETGLTENGVQKSFKDISGGVLPGISKWAGSLSGEFSTAATLFGKVGKFFIASDVYYRSSFSSSPSPSAYDVDGYTHNGRLGFKSINGLSAFYGDCNLFDENYCVQLLVAGGNARRYAV